MVRKFKFKCHGCDEYNLIDLKLIFSYSHSDTESSYKCPYCLDEHMIWKHIDKYRYSIEVLREGHVIADRSLFEW